MNPVDSPSPQRAAVLAFLQRELAAGRAPSLAEIALAFGFASRNAARKHVQALVADGLLEQTTGRSRGLRLPGGPADLLPLAVLGR
ncbi:MAG TPA: repressor LexA, partial [Thermomonas sp.]|nr:repressor LexA [Thermomonas sp.]